MSSSAGTGPGTERPNRRTFLGAVVVAVATALTCDSPARPRPSVVRSGEGHAPDASQLGAVGKRATSRTEAVPGRLPGEVRPTYAPPGYKLVYRYRGRPDGLRGGDAELALWYHTTRFPDSEFYPLCIYILRTPADTWLGGTEGRAGEPVLALHASGEQLSGVYHDGIWQGDRAHPDTHLRNGHPVRWDRHDVHSLVARYHEHLIGIRGSRLRGVTLQEMLAIASSVAASDG